MQVNHYPESSSSSHVASSNGSGSNRRTHRSSSSLGLITQHGGWPSQQDMLDQLTFSEFSSPGISSFYLPHSISEPARSSEMQSSEQKNGNLSSSLGATTPLESTQSSEATNAPVSSPSLRKILHPTNIGIFQKGASRTPGHDEVALKSAKPPASPLPEPEYLAEYTCPICFFPPTNATLTPCGHICCGSCLFTAVKSTIQRGAFMRADLNVARCPVCRADIPGWDGKGGGVIGLKPRAVLSL